MKDLALVVFDSQYFVFRIIIGQGEEHHWVFRHFGEQIESLV